MFIALLDTSVLWPSLQRDFLLSLAAEGLYRPRWSQAILDELADAELAKLIDRGASQEAAQATVRHLIDRMQTAFDDATVDGWEPLEGSYGLPDPDDEHVLAAAVVGGAEVIVTNNLKDFPKAAMPAGLRAIAPPEFLHDTVASQPSTAARAVREIVARSGRHGRRYKDSEELLLELETRYGCIDAVALIRGLDGED